MTPCSLVQRPLSWSPGPSPAPLAIVTADRAMAHPPFSSHRSGRLCGSRSSVLWSQPSGCSSTWANGEALEPPMPPPPADFDESVHQPNRLAILVLLREAGRADFGYLKQTLSLTDGNLGRHLAS